MATSTPRDVVDRDPAFKLTFITQALVDIRHALDRIDHFHCRVLADGLIYPDPGASKEIGAIRRMITEFAAELE